MNMYGDTGRRRRTYQRRDCPVVVIQAETREERVNRWFNRIQAVMAVAGMLMFAVYMGYLWMMGVI